MGTHEAAQGSGLRAAPAPPAGPPVLPPTTTWDAPVPASSFLAQPAPPQAPAGSSGLVPLRPGQPGTAVPASTGFVPGAVPVTASAPTRMRWDEKGARRRASATTFGLTGRIVITVLVVVVVAVLSYGNLFGIPLFLGAAAWLLRDLWAKARVVPPKAPAHPSAGRPGAFPPGPPTS